MCENDKDKRLEEGTRKLLEMKHERKRGRVTFFFDGSEKVSEIEIVEKK